MSDRYQKPIRCAVVTLSALLSGAAAAAGDDVPDAEFLEYLGSWEGTDEDWVLFREDARNDANEQETRSDPVPAGDESQEPDDEH